MKKSRVIFILFILITALAVVSTQALAQGKSPDDKGPKDKVENYRGTLVALDGGSIVVSVKDTGEQVTIAIAESTKVKIPGFKNATAADLILDSQVSVQAMRGQDDSLTARRITCIPGKPTKVHRVGVVIELSVTSITIQNDEGETSTFTITDETQIIRKNMQAELAVGVTVTIICPRDPGTEGLVAKGIVVHGPDDGEDGEEEGDDDDGAGLGNLNRLWRNGLVTDLSETSITIQTSEGQTYTYQITTDTQITYKNHKAELVIGAAVTVTAIQAGDDPLIAASITVKGPEDDED